MDLSPVLGWHSGMSENVNKRQQTVNSVPYSPTSLLVSVPCEGCPLWIWLGQSALARQREVARF